jgi:hypothetical protein
MKIENRVHSAGPHFGPRLSVRPSPAAKNGRPAHAIGGAVRHDSALSPRAADAAARPARSVEAAGGSTSDTRETHRAIPHWRGGRGEVGR